ncbi:unnamed protein product [Diplocarpon coronariae]
MAEKLHDWNENSVRNFCDVQQNGVVGGYERRPTQMLRESVRSSASSDRDDGVGSGASENDGFYEHSVSRNGEFLIRILLVIFSVVFANGGLKYLLKCMKAPLKTPRSSKNLAMRLTSTSPGVRVEKQAKQAGAP